MRVQDQPSGETVALKERMDLLKAGVDGRECLRESERIGDGSLQGRQAGDPAVDCSRQSASGWDWQSDDLEVVDPVEVVGVAGVDRQAGGYRGGGDHRVVRASRGLPASTTQ
jgi:hypothetical protein